MFGGKLIFVGIITYFSTILLINASQAIGVDTTPSQQLFRSLNKNLNRYSEFYSAKKESALLEAVNANNIEKINRYSKEINKLEREISELKKERTNRTIDYNNDRKNFEDTIAGLNDKISASEHKRVEDLAEQKQLHLKEIEKLDEKMEAEQERHNQETVSLKRSTDILIQKITKRHNYEMESLKDTTDQLTRKTVQKYQKEMSALKNLTENTLIENQRKNNYELNSFKKSLVEATRQKVKTSNREMDEANNELKLLREKEKILKIMNGGVGETKEKPKNNKSFWNDIASLWKSNNELKGKVLREENKNTSNTAWDVFWGTGHNSVKARTDNGRNPQKSWYNFWASSNGRISLEKLAFWK